MKSLLKKREMSLLEILKFGSTSLLKGKMYTKVNKHVTKDNIKKIFL
jgi:hypothetical protein